jgi:cellulose synthase/poly-beta-1,6-N-acetylglucosamine synthase-like glycosyltransferase
LNAWANDHFLGRPFAHGDDRLLTSYILGGTKHYVHKQEKAWKARYCSSAICYSEAQPTLKQLVRQNLRWKKSWFRVAIFNIPFFFKDRSPIISIYFYLETALTFLTTAVIIRSLVILPLQGNYWDAAIYILGVIFVGMLYGLDFSVRHQDSERWPYRILMALLGSFFLDLLFYYAILTMKNKSWLTR